MYLFDQLCMPPTELSVSPIAHKSQILIFSKLRKIMFLSIFFRLKGNYYIQIIYRRKITYELAKNRSFL